jgi:hypothetical protein
MAALLATWLKVDHWLLKLIPVLLLGLLATKVVTNKQAYLKVLLETKRKNSRFA